MLGEWEFVGQLVFEVRGQGQGQGKGVGVGLL